MPIGIIKMWNRGRGFGFIRPEDGSEEVFFHLSGLEGLWTPAVGDRVTYVMGANPRHGRPRAEEVEPVT